MNELNKEMKAHRLTKQKLSRLKQDYNLLYMKYCGRIEVNQLLSDVIKTQRHQVEELYIIHGYSQEPIYKNKGFASTKKS